MVWSLPVITCDWLHAHKTHFVFLTIWDVFLSIFVCRNKTKRAGLTLDSRLVCLLSRLALNELLETALLYPGPVHSPLWCVSNQGDIIIIRSLALHYDYTNLPTPFPWGILLVTWRWRGYFSHSPYHSLFLAHKYVHWWRADVPWIIHELDGRELDSSF